MDHIVREMWRDPIKRKVGELDVLGINDFVITIVAKAIRDGIEKPIEFNFLGEILSGIGIGDVPVESATIDALASKHRLGANCELRDVVRLQVCRQCADKVEGNPGGTRLGRSR